MKEELRSSTEDVVVWIGFVKGSKEHFEEIYRRYMPVLYDYGHKLFGRQLNVEDAVHDFFLHLSQRGERLPQPDSVKAYMLTAFRNHLLKQLRSKAHMPLVDTDDLHFELHFLQAEGADSLLLQQETIDEVNRAINLLPPRQKEIIYLKFFHELSNSEIAAIMKIEPASVYKLLYKAMDSLKIKLEKIPAILLMALFARLLR